MKEVAFLERLAEDLLEGSFNRILRPKLQPVQVAKALVREMERSQVVGAEGPLAANQYVAYLHPEDLAGLASFQVSLERELASYLEHYAAGRGVKLLAHPTVRLLPAETPRRKGRVKVEAFLVDEEPDGAPTSDSPPPPGWEGTAEMAVPPPEVCAEVPRREAVLVDEDGHTIPLPKAETSIGRSVDNDIVLESGDVSRQHARIAWEAGEYVLIDLGSTNGSFVDGQRVARRVLSGGEQISFGSAHFTFQFANQ